MTKFKQTKCAVARYGHCSHWQLNWPSGSAYAGAVAAQIVGHQLLLLVQTVVVIIGVRAAEGKSGTLKMQIDSLVDHEPDMRCICIWVNLLMERHL
jgi:hypothetical protein